MDVFLLQDNTLMIIEPKYLSHDKLEHHTFRFLAAVETLSTEYYIKAKKEANAVLKWLWDAAMEPTLKGLGFKTTPAEGQVWPRIRCVANGQLNLLSIHAVGYNELSGQNMLDRVILSYVSTVKVLVYACERHYLAGRQE